MGTSTNSMAMFKSKLLVYRKVPPISWMIYFMDNPNLKKWIRNRGTPKNDFGNHHKRLGGTSGGCLRNPAGPKGWMSDVVRSSTVFQNWWFKFLPYTRVLSSFLNLVHRLKHYQWHLQAVSDYCHMTNEKFILHGYSRGFHSPFLAAPFSLPHLPFTSHYCRQTYSVLSKNDGFAHGFKTKLSLVA